MLADYRINESSNKQINLIFNSVTYLFIILNYKPLKGTEDVQSNVLNHRVASGGHHLHCPIRYGWYLQPSGSPIAFGSIYCAHRRPKTTTRENLIADLIQVVKEGSGYEALCWGKSKSTKNSGCQMC